MNYNSDFTTKFFNHLQKLANNKIFLHVFAYLVKANSAAIPLAIASYVTNREVSTLIFIILWSMIVVRIDVILMINVSKFLFSFRWLFCFRASSLSLSSGKTKLRRILIASRLHNVKHWTNLFISLKPVRLWTRERQITMMMMISKKRIGSGTRRSTCTTLTLFLMLRQFLIQFWDFYEWNERCLRVKFIGRRHDTKQSKLKFRRDLLHVINLGWDENSWSDGGLRFIGL